MLARLVIAVVYGIITAIVLIIVGTIIVALGAGPFDTIGHLLVQFAWIIGALVAVLIFFQGGFSFPSFGSKA